MDKKELCEKMAGILDQKKALDIQLIDIEGRSSLADWFVIASGENERQVAALADELEWRISEEEGISPRAVEGTSTNRWILMDYGDVVVHLFHKKDREFYSLDHFWMEPDHKERPEKSDN